jgi:hypothetical protein
MTLPVSAKAEAEGADRYVNAGLIRRLVRVIGPTPSPSRPLLCSHFPA